MYPSRSKLAFYAILTLLSCLIALPNILSHQQLAHIPSWLPKQQVILGLDLKGGAHLVLEIDQAALAKDRLDSLADQARHALRSARMAGTEDRVGCTVREGATGPIRTVCP
jgi:preprotein translocase subunit SecD